MWISFVAVLHDVIAFFPTLKFHGELKSELNLKSCAFPCSCSVWKRRNMPDSDSLLVQLLCVRNVRWYLDICCLFARSHCLQPFTLCGKNLMQQNIKAYENLPKFLVKYNGHVILRPAHTYTSLLCVAWITSVSEYAPRCAHDFLAFSEQ